MNEDMSAVLGDTGQLESVGHKAIIYFYKNFNEDYIYWCHTVICSSKLHDHWMNSIPLVNWKILSNIPVVILPLSSGKFQEKHNTWLPIQKILKFSKNHYHCSILIPAKPWIGIQTYQATYILKFKLLAGIPEL